MTDLLENKTFDEIRIGDAESVTRAFREQDIETWAAITGNVNLVHAYRVAEREGVPAHEGGFGIWGTAVFSTIIGTRLPGPGSLILSAQIRFVRPFTVGERVTSTVTVKDKFPDRQVVLLDCHCADSDGNDLIIAAVEVQAPATKISEPLPELPTVHLRREDRYLELLKVCEGLEPLTTAVVHPCSDDALAGAIEAAKRNLIEPILVGPGAKIRAIADEEGLDISRYRSIDTEHSHHAAEQAVAMIRAGEAEALMKGSLHTDELLHAVLRKDTGIRTERRLSHCFLLAVPTYERPIIVTDAAINIYPKLEEKRDICQNAIDMARALGMKQPKVAILSAVETVTPVIPSTLEAAALCKMAERGQIKGGLLDGPLAFDNAVDEQAAQTKGIVSPVAGKADILVVPDLEAGNMLAKQLTFMADAEAAGIVLGARVPIILTSRADSVRTRLASCAVAVLLAHAHRESGAKVPAAE